MDFLKIYTTLICQLFLVSLFAQAPVVESVSPSNLRNDVPDDYTISITFDTALDLETVDYSHFKVFGRWSGPAEISFSMSDDNHTVNIEAFDPFMAGEWVTVSVTKGVKSVAGDSSDSPYVFNFMIETKNGNLDQPLIQTIELKQPGEGWLQTYGAYAGDLNNDGYSDLTIVNENSDDLRILLNDGTGSYSDDFEIYPMGNSTPSPNEGADFDGDGEIDLAVCTAHDSELRILMGDGAGSFDSMDNYTTGEAARGVGIIDIDGDGDDDILITNRDDGNVNLFTNDGSANFTKTTFNPDGNGESAIAIVDANNDGIHDAFIGMYSSEEIAILLGDGNGNLVLHDKIDVNGRPWMITAGDFNNDGFADVASANSSQDLMVVVLNDGSGGLLSPTNYPASDGDFPLAIDAGDLDGDGDLDIVTTYYSSSTYVVFENDGSGVYTIAATLSAPSNASCAILHDRDNDGDLDITGTDETADVVLIFENDAVNANEEVSLINTFEMEASPNPFTEQTVIQYELNEKVIHSVEIIDINGKTIHQLINQEQKMGLQTITWDGTNGAGAKVGQGTYFVVLKAGAQIQSFQITRF